MAFCLAFVKETKSHSLFPRGLFYMVLNPREHKYSRRNFGRVQGKLAEKDTSTGKPLEVSSSHRFSCSQLDLINTLKIGRLKISAHIVSVLFCWLNACRQQPYKACGLSLFFCPLFLSHTNQNTDTHTHTCTYTVTACQQL